MSRTQQIDTSKALVIKTKSGLARQIKTPVKLSIEEKTLVKTGMKEKVVDDNGREQWLPVVMTTAQGFAEQAANAALQLFVPDTVVVNGVEQHNPTVVEDRSDPDHPILRAYARCKCGGFTPLGSKLVTDRTSCLDVPLYNTIDLLAKAKYDGNTNVVRVLPARADAPGDSWAPYNHGPVTVWLNVGVKEGIKIFTEMLNREKKAVEIVQSFAQRNAIKAHPAIPAKQTCNARDRTVMITAWRDDEGTPVQIKGDEIDDGTITVDAKVEDVTPDSEDDAEALAAARDAQADVAVDPQDLPEPEDEGKRLAMQAAEQLGMTNLTPQDTANEIWEKVRQEQNQKPKVDDSDDLPFFDEPKK